MAATPHNSSAEEERNRPPPRLNALGRQCVHLLMAKHARWSQGPHQPQQPFLRFHLVSQSYANSAVDSQDVPPVKIIVYSENSITMQKFEFEKLLANSFESIAALLRLARDVTTLEIRWHPSKLSVRLMTAWMRVATALHDCRSLVSLRLDTGGERDRTSHFLIDSLPDRVTHVQTGGDVRIATSLRKRKWPLNVFEVEGRTKPQPYLADVFRLKARRIFFLPDDEQTTALRVLPHSGPFARNEHLQQLRIRMLDLNEGSLLQALQHLRCINGHFKLVCLVDPVPIQELEDWKKPDDPAPLNRFKSEAKKLVALMRAAGFGLKYARKGDERTNDAQLRILIDYHDEHKRRYPSKVLKRLHWGRQTDVYWRKALELVPTCSTVYCGVRIVVGLDDYY